MTEDPSIDSDAAAIDALKQIGLSTYGAEVFVALQKLETGTASEIAEISEVPRSQVYGTTEDLEARGLIEVQQGTPTRYRPVAVEEARDRVLANLRTTGEAAFDYVQSVQGEHAGDGHQSEAIWTVQGSPNVAARCESLIEDATADVLYAASDRDHMEESILSALEDAQAQSVAVTVVSAAEPVRRAARDRLDASRTRRVPSSMDLDVSTGRVLIVDDATVLMSLPPSNVLPHLPGETGFWSSDTGFATFLGAILREWFGEATVGRSENSDGATESH